MTKQKFIFWIVALLTILLAVVLIASRWTAKAINPNSEEIANLTFQLSELEFQRRNCLDNLSRKQSEAQFQWFAKYCVEYDEQMMLIQSKIDELTERKAESETDTAWTAELRTPWMLNESWDAQQMPEIEWNDSHEKFKKLADLTERTADTSNTENVEAQDYGAGDGTTKTRYCTTHGRVAVGSDNRCPYCEAEGLDSRTVKGSTEYI